MSEAQWSKIQTTQNKALKTIYGLPPKISTDLLYKVTGEIPIRTVLETQACNRIHKILDNTAGVSKYLWDFKKFQKVGKYPSLLQFYMNSDITPFTNQFKCPLCSFRINHACTLPPEFS